MPFGIVSAWNKRRRSKSQDHSDPWVYKPVEFWQLEDQTPRSTKRRHGSSVFTLKEMEEATCSFNEKNLVGKGGFGRVYRGVLRSGEVVAIKKMELPTFKEAEGEREFRVEVDILSRLEHPNLVSLIGYCADGKHRFLVYEYLQHGNLQDHLNGFGKAKMEWPLRLKVALGAARGLAYLHSSSDVGIPIVHRDFKSTNILLNANFEAKISDFGLAKLMPEGQEIFVTARVLGTFGYFDPEYTSTGKLTLQSDVYAFGVVLLELLTGRRAVDLNQGPSDQNLVLQVRHILNDRKKLRKVIDPELSRSSFTLESIAMFANLASRCIRIESSERPSMAECVKELQTIICNTICLRHEYDNYKQGIAGPSYRIPGQNQLNWMVSTTWPDYMLKDLRNMFHDFHMSICEENSISEPEVSSYEGFFETKSFLHIKCLHICNINSTHMLSVLTML